MNRVPWAAWLAVSIPIVVLLGPVLVTDRSFAMRDAAHFYYPLYEWCCREWAAGRVPLWNPYENCGIPVLADTTSSVLYPGKLVFLLPVDFGLRYKLFVTLHVVLAASGSYLLARAWKASSYAAAVAAIAYACGGNVVFQYCNVVFLIGAAWLPLAALAADRMLSARSWRSAVLLGVILALMILGGDPQAAYHVLLISGLYALILALAKDDATGDAGDSHNRASLLRVSRVTTLVVSVALTGLAAVVGFVLAAVQILPSSEATRYSERAAFNRPRNIYEAAAVALQPADASQPLDETRWQSIARGLLGAAEPGSHHDLAFDFSVGPWRIAEYLWPNVGGRMFPTNRRWFSLLPAEGRTWTPTLYLGLLPVLLGLSSFCLLRGPRRHRWLSWLVLIFTLASFGQYGIGWILHEANGWLLRGDGSKLAIGHPVGGVYWLFVTLLPTYVYFRYPAKLLPIVSLGLSQLAAVGWDRAFTAPRPKLARTLLLVGGASGTAAFVVWCLGPRLFAGTVQGDSSLGPFDAAGAQRDVLLALVHAALVAFAGRWLLRKAWSESESVRHWQRVALLLTAVELAVANHWLVATAPGELWRSEPTVGKAITAAAANSTDDEGVPPRVFRGSLSGWRPPSFAKTMSHERPAELAQWEHDTLFPKYNLKSQISLVESYGSIKMLDYESLLFVAKQHGPQQPDKSVLPQPAALRLTGTQFLLLPQTQQPEFAEPVVGAPKDENWPENAVLWHMQRTLPRAWVVRAVETLPPLPRPLRVAAVDERTKTVLFPGNKARDFRRSAVVETDQPLAEWSRQPAADETADPAEPCRIAHYDSQRVVVEAELTRPGLLVLSDAWFPGWKAVVTTAGQWREATIYRTDRILRGVWLPEGQHSIEFRYQPASFVRGAAISSASWTALALLGVVLLVRGAHLRGTTGWAGGVAPTAGQGGQIE